VVLLTPVCLLLTDLLRLILLVLLLLGRRTKILVHGLIGRQWGRSEGACSGAACSGAVKTSISASLWRPLNEVPYKQNI
jgi:hypothetical protein